MVGYILLVIYLLYVWLYCDGCVYITIHDLMYMSDDVGHIVGHNIQQIAWLYIYITKNNWFSDGHMCDKMDDSI